MADVPVAPLPRGKAVIGSSLPREVSLTLADEVYIDRTNLPPGLIAYCS